MFRQRFVWLATLVLSAAVVMTSERPLRALPFAAQQDEKEEAKKTEGFSLKTAETLEFTTDEVTWMSIDVSPDGKTIVFDLLGDLYTMPATGGAATRIIGGLSFESQPTWSPDGKTLAFLTDRTGVENLWIADADGSNPRPVSKDTKTNDRPQIMVSPAWTPDGEYIVVSKSRPPTRARSGCSCITATAGRACGSAPHRPRSLHPTHRVHRRRRHPIGWAPSSRPTAASSTTRSEPEDSRTTRGSRCGRSIATTARRAT